MSETVKYRLTLTEAQARLAMEALDLVARLDIGQIWTLRDFFSSRVLGEKGPTFEELEASFQALKALVFPGMSYQAGPSTGAAPPRAQIAWDLYEVIRHRIAWDRNPEGGVGVHFHEPAGLGPEPLAQIEKVGPPPPSDLTVEDLIEVRRLAASARAVSKEFAVPQATLEVDDPKSVAGLLVALANYADRLMTERKGYKIKPAPGPAW